MAKEQVFELGILEPFRSDCRGECDRCHKDPVNLGTEWDSEEGWRYCRTCWEHYRAAAIAARTGDVELYRIVTREDPCID